MIHRAQRLYRSNRNPFEVTRGVTSLAVGAKISAMRVTVTLETAMTAYWKTQIQFRGCNLLPIGNAQRWTLGGPRLMAKRASRFLVRATLGELRHAVVVELWGPLLGTVALGAVLAKPSAVLVVLLVTVEAAVLVQLVLVLAVT